MLHLHLGPYHVFMKSVNFWREVMSLTSSGKEFQIVGPNVLRLFSPYYYYGFTLLLYCEHYYYYCYYHKYEF